MICFAFNFRHILTFSVQLYIHYMEVHFMFAVLDFVGYNDDFVKSRFCSIHFTVILERLKKIVRGTQDFVI